jgi:hypothetical protein
VLQNLAGGLIRITIDNAKTALLECGRYMDSLQLTIGDVVSPLWLGVILVAANPRRCCRRDRPRHPRRQSSRQWARLRFASFAGPGLCLHCAAAQWHGMRGRREGSEHDHACGGAGVTDGSGVIASVAGESDPTVVSATGDAATGSGSVAGACCCSSEACSTGACSVAAGACSVGACSTTGSVGSPCDIYVSPLCLVRNAPSSLPIKVGSTETRTVSSSKARLVSPATDAWIRSVVGGRGTLVPKSIERRAVDDS